MKKVITLIICLFVAIALSLTVFAEEAPDTTDIDEDLPAIVETVPISDTAAVPDTDSPTAEEVVGIVKTTSDKLVSWVKKNYEEIAVIVSLLFTAFLSHCKQKSLNKSMGILNNNAIAVSDKSEKAIKEVYAKMQQMAEDKKVLEEMLANVTKLVNTAKLANIELANEVAELLVLANIPNAKKEELYARHRKAVDAIASSEVKAYDGQKA